MMINLEKKQTYVFYRNRIIFAILAVCICMALSACSHADAESTAEWRSAEETSAEGSGAGSGQKDFTETADLQEAAVLTEESSEEETSDAKEPPTDGELYQKMIDTARECLLTEGEDWKAEVYEIETWIREEGMELSFLFSEGICPWETLGYLIRDINGDGIDELIFGGNVTDDASLDRDGVIYDVYTIRDGKLHQVLNGWEKCEFYLCEDGSFANEIPGGAGNLTFMYWEYDGTELKLIEAVREETRAYDDTKYYYSETDPYDEDSRTQISIEEMEAIKGNYVYSRLAFTPFCERPEFKQITLDFPDAGEMIGEGEENRPFRLTEITKEENEGSTIEDWLSKEEIYNSDEDGWFYIQGYRFNWDGGKWVIKDWNANPRYEILPPAGGMESGWNNAWIQDGILYAGMVYDPSVPSAGYLFAYDLEKEEYLWKSPENTYNNKCFLLSEGVILCGCGTDEGKTYIYQIDQGTGRVLDQLEVQGEPDFFEEKDGKLYVHTESYDYIFEMKLLTDSE